MYMTIQGIVLRVTDYKDRDALLTLLTGTQGKITVKARGLRRKNSPLVAPCQLLAYGEFTVFEYRGMYTINEAHSLELFQGLRRDLQKLSLGTYFAQVAEVISQEDLPNPELLSLTLNCLYALAKLDVAEQLVKAALSCGLPALRDIPRICSAATPADTLIRTGLTCLPDGWNVSPVAAPILTESVCLYCREPSMPCSTSFPAIRNGCSRSR